MEHWLILGVMYLVFQTFDLIITQLIKISMQQTPLTMSQFDRDLASKPHIKLFIVLYVLVMRLVGWALLIYMAFSVGWLVPLIIIVVSFPASAFIVTFVYKRFGLILPSYIGLIALPIIAIGIWVLI